MTRFGKDASVLISLIGLRNFLPEMVLELTTSCKSSVKSIMIQCQCVVPVGYVELPCLRVRTS